MKPKCSQQGHPKPVPGPWPGKGRNISNDGDPTMFVGNLFCCLSKQRVSQTIPVFKHQPSQLSAVWRLPRVLCSPSSESLIKSFNSIGPTVSPWGAQPVPGCSWTWCHWPPPCKSQQLSCFSVHLLHRKEKKRERQKYINWVYKTAFA